MNYVPFENVQEKQRRRVWITYGSSSVAESFRYNHVNTDCLKRNNIRSLSLWNTVGGDSCNVKFEVHFIITAMSSGSSFSRAEKMCYKHPLLGSLVCILSPSATCPVHFSFPPSSTSPLFLISRRISRFLKCSPGRFRSFSAAWKVTPGDLIRLIRGRVNEREWIHFNCGYV